MFGDGGRRKRAQPDYLTDAELTACKGHEDSQPGTVGESFCYDDSIFHKHYYNSSNNELSIREKSFCRKKRTFHAPVTRL